MKKTKGERVQARIERRKRIKAFFLKVAAWFKNLEETIEEKLPELIEISLKVMKFIKGVADSKITDLITDLIPGEIDDFVLDKVKDSIDKTILALGDGKVCMELPTWEERVLCFAEFVKTLPIIEQQMRWEKFQSVFMANYDDNKKTASEYSYLAAVSHLGQNFSETQSA